jgi:CHAT domain-containing protein
MFFYAGARALLVSRWEVHNAATVKLIITGGQARAEQGPPTAATV